MEGARQFCRDGIGTVVYHSPCDDGHAAAAVLWLTSSSPYMYGVQPGAAGVGAITALLKTDDFQSTGGGATVFVDVCFSYELMAQVAGHVEKLIVLDHHTTNRATLARLAELPNVRTVYEDGVAGVCLAWRFRYGDTKPMPDSLHYIGLRDVWKHENVEDAVHFTAAFLCPRTWDEWLPHFEDKQTQALIRDGRVICAYQRRMLEVLAERAQYTRWRGMRMAVVNVPHPWTSDLGHLLCAAQPEHTVAVVWSKGATGSYSVSLRSDDKGPDVERVAREFGGGGHAHAAGMRTERPPYELFTDDGKYT